MFLQQPEYTTKLCNPQRDIPRGRSIPGSFLTSASTLMLPTVKQIPIVLPLKLSSWQSTSQVSRSIWRNTQSHKSIRVFEFLLKQENWSKTSLVEDNSPLKRCTLYCVQFISSRTLHLSKYPGFRLCLPKWGIQKKWNYPHMGVGGRGWRILYKVYIPPLLCFRCSRKHFSPFFPERSQCSQLLRFSPRPKQGEKPIT